MPEEVPPLDRNPPGHFLRKLAALSSVVLLTTDYYRDPAIFTSLSMWILIVHFIYFQLPLKSRALAYFHGVSFIASIIMPFTYFQLRYFHPSLDTEYMHSWKLPISMIYLRTAAIYFAPLVYHVLESILYLPQIVASYRNKSIWIIGLWTISLLSVLHFIYGFACPQSDETSTLQGISHDDFFRLQKLIYYSVLGLSFVVYSQLVLRKAFQLQSILGSRRSSGNLHEKSQ